MLSKFVGETEKNVRDLFADAEQDQRTRGRIILHLDFQTISFPHFYAHVFKLFQGIKVTCM